MNNQMLRPKGIGGILDSSFQLYRNHYKTVILSVFIFFAPYYFIDLIIAFSGRGLGTLPSFQQDQSWKNYFNQLNQTSGSPGQMPAMPAHLGMLLALIFILIPLLLFLLLPLAVSMLLHFTEAARKGEEVRLSRLLKRTFRRFWPIFGSSLLMGLIGFGFYLVTVLAGVFIGGIIGGLAAAFVMNYVNKILGIVLIVIVIAALVLGIIWVLCYFLTRFIYFLPVVVLEKNAPGLGRSWVLTRRNFWRLFGLGVLVMVMVYMFSLGFGAAALIFHSALIQVLQILFLIVISPLAILPYTVAYFDLKVRSDGTDLLESVQGMEEGTSGDVPY